MNKKLVSIIIILILFVVILSIYKYNCYDTKNEHYFDYTEIKNIKRDVEKSEVIDKDIYSDKIINENLLSIDYNFFYNEESITGKVYIGLDKYLYITDINNNSVYRVSSTKFKTLYAKDYEYEVVYIYLISMDNKLYFMELGQNDIRQVHIEEITANLGITNFVEIDFTSDMYQPGNTLFVLAENGNIYDIGSATRYREDIVSLFNNIYVYGDKTMSNVSGYMLEDKNGDYYKIKYIFYTSADNEFTTENTIIIITEDNKFLYVDGDVTHVYEFDKKVSAIEFDVYYPYITGNLKIKFEDDFEMKFKARCNEYFCINEFVE